MPSFRLIPADLLQRARAIRHEPAPAALWQPLRGELDLCRMGVLAHLRASSESRDGGRVRPRRGFTLLEMLTTVAALVIVLGLMVDLARYVRNDSSVKLTKQLLYQCDLLLAQYRLHHAGQLPAVEPFANAPDHLEEAVLQHRAFENNRDFVAALRTEAGGVATLFGGLPDSIYNEATLSDAWGSPIVFMPSMHREIGVAPQDHSFFFSAGPDRRYLTQDDNLYSYEEKGLEEGTETRRHEGTKGE